jgi:hypothetical protein
MGRYYCGDISGKFWFGVQSSNDASEYGIKHKKVFTYFLCNCNCENKKNRYCTSCYESYDEHREAIINDDSTEITKRRKNLWYESDTEIWYNIRKCHTKIIKEKVDVLESQVGKYMSNYIIKDDDNEIRYDYDAIDNNIEKETQELLARLCLGKQILYCLRKQDKCVFYAEL